MPGTRIPTSGTLDVYFTPSLSRQGFLYVVNRCGIGQLAPDKLWFAAGFAPEDGVLAELPAEFDRCFAADVENK